MTAVFCDIYLFLISTLFKILGMGHLFIRRLGTGKKCATVNKGLTLGIYLQQGLICAPFLETHCFDLTIGRADDSLLVASVEVRKTHATIRDIRRIPFQPQV
jgi:hypothetical protein